MPREFQTVAVTRAGEALPGSPFQARVYHASFTGRGTEIAPAAAKVQSTEVASFRDVSAPVRVGDLVTLPDGALAKIVDRRGYSRSLQCDLQRLPYAPMRLWTPTKPLQRVDPTTLKVLDVTYIAAGTELAYLEPAPDMAKASVIGRLDVRACYAFTIHPLALGAVLVDAQGEGWVSVVASDVWDVTNDVRTLVRHTLTLPTGVS